MLPLSSSPISHPTLPISLQPTNTKFPHVLRTNQYTNTKERAEKNNYINLQCKIGAQKSAITNLMGANNLGILKEEEDGVEHGIKQGKDPIFEGINFKNMFRREEACDPHKIKIGKWTEKEEWKLVGLVNKYKKDWVKISFLMGNRTRYQVKDKYRNLKKRNGMVQFSPEEDNKILFFYHYFKANWPRVAEYLDGRDYNKVKNRYYSNLRHLMGKDEARKRYKEILEEINIERKMRGVRNILGNYDIAESDGNSSNTQIKEISPKVEYLNSEDIFTQFSYNLQKSNIDCRNMMDSHWAFHTPLPPESIQTLQSSKNSISENYNNPINILRQQEIQIRDTLLWVQESIDRLKKEFK